MGLRRPIALLLLAAALAPPAALAHSHKKKTLEIVHPWTTAMMEERVVNVAVYMKLKNAGPRRRAPAQRHEPARRQGRADRAQGRGRREAADGQPGRLSFPARGELVLGPDGPRLLLSGFKKRLNAYDSFELTLVFEKVGRMVVEVMVEEAEIKEPHKH